MRRMFLKIPMPAPVIAAAFMLMATALRADTNYSFQTLNNNADPAFNQLLSINNAGTIAGYFGDGNQVANHGYTLAPPYSQGSYTNENFPGSFQTQVTGINNASAPLTVGFWADTAGDNFGWVKQGANFIQVVDPNTPAAAAGVTPFNQLLGVNDKNLAAGFYLDANGNSHGYLYSIANGSFTAVDVSTGMSSVATGVNNSGLISGFFTDANGTHGFIDNAGKVVTYDDPNGRNTMFLGLNNNGQVVGTYVDANGMTNGLVYNLAANTWQTVDDPLQSANAAFDVTGTTVNGINDAGQLVGFYSDGTNVNGFLATAAPEPASIGLFGAAFVMFGLGWRKRRNRS